MTDAELHWLAGLLEGEGCFTPWVSPTTKKATARLSISMVDEDVISRVAVLLNRTYYKKTRSADREQQQYRVEIKGKKAVEIMEILLPLMGQRRQARMRQTITLAS